MSKELYFSSLRGENLIPEDGKTCDPYVIVKVGTETYTTEYVTGNHANPVWTKLDKFILPWDGKNAMPEIELIAMDHDTVFSDDFLGYARIRLHPSMIGTEIRVLLGPRSESDSKLLSKYGTLGHLFVKIDFVDKKFRTYSSPAVTPDFSIVQPSPDQRGGGFSAQRNDVQQQQQSRQPQQFTQATPNRPAAGVFASPAASHQFVPQRSVQQQPQQHYQQQNSQQLSPGYAGYRVTSIRAEDIQVEENTQLVVVTLVGDADEWRSIERPSSRGGHVEWPVMKIDIPQNPQGALPIVGFLVVSAGPDNGGARSRIVASARVQLTSEMAETDNQLVCDDGRGCIVFHLAGPPSFQPQQQQETVYQEHQQPYQTQQQLYATYETDMSRSTNHNMSQQQQPAASSSSGPLRAPADGLMVELLCANNLLPRDYELQPSDPFVIVLGMNTRGEVAQLARSTTIRSNADPVWKERLAISALNYDIVALRLYVFDEDPNQTAEFLGQYSFDLSKMPATGEGVFQLGPRADGADAADDLRILRRFKRPDFGTISVRWVLDSAIVNRQRTMIAPVASSAPALQYPSTQPTAPQRSAYPIGQQPQVRAIEATPITNVASVSQVSSVTVTVLSVTNISGRCSPYVRVICGNDVRDNFKENIPEAQTVGMNFTSEFRMPRSSNPQQARPYPARIELCDAHSSANPIGLVQFDVPADTNAKFETRTFPVIRTASRSIRGDTNTIVSPSDVIAEMTVLYKVGPFYATQAAPTDAVLSLTIVGAKGLVPPSRGVKKFTNPYVIATVYCGSTKQEYRTTTVENSRGPLWFYQLPSLDITPQDVAVLTVWDQDTYGFDEVLGQTKLSIGSLMQSPTVVDLPLEGPSDAAGRSADSHGSESFGHLSVEYTVTDRHNRASTSFVAESRILEVTVVEAKDLVDSNFMTVCAQMTIDDQSAAPQSNVTELVDKRHAKFDKTFTATVEGSQSQARFTLFDYNDSRATFLGECVLRLSQLANSNNPGTSNNSTDTAASGSSTEAFVLQLRPRQDIRFHRDDVILLNRSTRGLGTLKVTAKAYTIREYEVKRREMLKSTGKSYQFVVQVADSADITTPGQYYVDVTAAGVHKASHIEEGTHPKFRKSFDFTLYDEMEMVSLALMRRVDGAKTREELIGDVTFPVTRPVEANPMPVEQWLTLRSKSSNEPMAPKLFLRWRAFVVASVEGSAQQEISVESSGDVWRASNVGTKPHDGVAALQRELAAARREIAQLRESTAASPAALRVLAPPTPVHNPHPFSVNVFFAQNNDLGVFHGTTESTAADIVQFSVHEFHIPAAQGNILALYYRQEVLPQQEPVVKFVREHETLMLAYGSTTSSSFNNNGTLNASYPSEHETSYDRQNTSGNTSFSRNATTVTSTARPSSPPRGPHAQGNSSNYGLATSPHRAPSPAHRQNQIVVERIARMAERRETNFVSCFLVTKKTLESSDAGAIVDICAHNRINGFCRPVRNGGIEFFIQATPEGLLPALEGILALESPDLLIEEARGYIPMLEVGFRVTRSRTEGAKMFEVCSAALNGDRSRCWFYKIDVDPTLIGTRYIDERA